MKTYIKIISVLFIIVMIFMISNQVYAAICPVCNGTGHPPGASGVKCPRCGGYGVISGGTQDAGDIVSGADAFISTGEAGASNKISESGLKDMSDTIYNILLVVGIIVVIIVGLIMGIKFIMGSLEEKADIKAMLIPYIIGCVVVFGAFTIWKIVVDLLQSV